MLSGGMHTLPKSEVARMQREEEEEEAFEVKQRDALTQLNKSTSSAVEKDDKGYPLDSPICYPGPREGDNPHLTGNCYATLKTQGNSSSHY
jgi:hypothetical protein